jgi:hypothetical protein
MTEINGASETWLMTCNHAEGDLVADGVCRATLASLKLANDFGRPDPVLVQRLRWVHRYLDPVMIPLMRVFLRHQP